MKADWRISLLWDLITVSLSLRQSLMVYRFQWWCVKLSVFPGSKLTVADEESHLWQHAAWVFFTLRMALDWWHGSLGSFSTLSLTSSRRSSSSASQGFLLPAHHFVYKHLGSMKIPAWPHLSVPSITALNSKGAQVQPSRLSRLHLNPPTPTPPPRIGSAPQLTSATIFSSITGSAPHSHTSLPFSSMSKWVTAAPFGHFWTSLTQSLHLKCDASEKWDFEVYPNYSMLCYILDDQQTWKSRWKHVLSVSPTTGWSHMLNVPLKCVSKQPV